jgi:hypothetical protein
VLQGGAAGAAALADAYDRSLAPAVCVGLGRIVASYYRSPTVCQIH